MPQAAVGLSPIVEARPMWSGGQSPGCKAARRLCELAAFATAASFAVPVHELHAATRRDPTVAFARQSAMYLAHVSFGLSYSAVGRAFGRDRTTAAHACRLVEDRRDDPRIDAVLGSLESACRKLRSRLTGEVRQ